MATRQPSTWLVISYLDNQVLLGRARYDGDNDLLTVTTLKHGVESTQGGGGDLQGLARLVLIDLHRKQWTP